MRTAFGAAKHHVLATLRADGSPRVSGTEVDMRGDELLLGSMLRARKALDLRRDGRFALHANPGDGSMDPGDAKVAGIAVEVTDPEAARALVDPGADPGGFHLFRLLLTKAALTSVAGDRLRIRHWHPGRGLVDEYRDS
ncbi:pyridoxamine 5'-phosphate oxidase family protein [Streptomonospora sp. PA3]|nr:pyridoxamine 5'-phosphate oxidase family protein [Streptomonospora sp. PA3]